MPDSASIGQFQTGDFRGSLHDNHMGIRKADLDWRHFAFGARHDLFLMTWPSDFNPLQEAVVRLRGHAG